MGVTGAGDVLRLACRCTRAACAMTTTRPPHSTRSPTTRRITSSRKTSRVGPVLGAGAGVVAALPRAGRSHRAPAGEATEGDRRRHPLCQGDPPLCRLVVCSFVVIMFGFNYVAFIPAFVKGTFELGDGSVGLLMSASSIGAVLIGVRNEIRRHARDRETAAAAKLDAAYADRDAARAQLDEATAAPIAPHGSSGQPSSGRQRPSWAAPFAMRSRSSRRRRTSPR